MPTGQARSVQRGIQSAQRAALPDHRQLSRARRAHRVHSGRATAWCRCHCLPLSAAGPASFSHKTEPQRTSRPQHVERLRGRGQHEPVPGNFSPADVSHKEESHACCRLLPRPPGPHLDRGHVTFRAGNSSEPGQLRTAASPRSVGHAAKDARGDQRTRSHRPKHRPGESLG
jgi:hypothetical protein